MKKIELVVFGFCKKKSVLVYNIHFGPQGHVLFLK